jgi:hypothetical protein
LETGEGQFEDRDLSCFDPLLTTRILVAGEENMEAAIRSG